MSVNAISSGPSLSLLPEARAGEDSAVGTGVTAGQAALPPGAQKILQDGLQAAEEAAAGNVIPGLLSLTQSTFHQVRMCGQIAENACKDTQPGEDKKASNNPTGLG